MKKIKVLLLILFTILCINSLNVVKAAEEKYSRGISEIVHNRIIG